MIPSLVYSTSGKKPSLVNGNLQDLPERYGWPTTNDRGYHIKEQLSGTQRRIRVIHLGAGASGFCFSKFASETLENVDFCCYDKNPDVGGTWLENRSRGFPPISCFDVANLESLDILVALVIFRL